MTEVEMTDEEGSKVAHVLTVRRREPIAIANVTYWPFLFDQTFQQPIDSLTNPLSRPHLDHYNFAGDYD